MKLTKEEIVALNTLQENSDTLIKELGEIKLAEMNLKKRQKSAEDFLESLKKQEKQVAKVLEDKYGAGSIDVQKGEFTSKQFYQLFVLFIYVDKYYVHKTGFDSLSIFIIET